MKSGKFKLLCCLVYFFSYLTRQNYAAALTEIIDDLEVTKSLASVAVTASFVSYGAFQIVSGFFGDKFKPEKIIFVGLFGSASVNVLVWLFPNIYVMNVLWCFNGVFQSLIWPPLVRMIVDNLSIEEYSTTVVRVTQASYLATVGVYVLTPAIISCFDWKYVFLIFGCLSIVFSFVWLFETKKKVVKNVGICDETINHENSNSETEGEGKKLTIRFLISLGIIPMLFATFVAGFVRDGISTWMPTYINDVYKMGAFSSILTGAVIPVCSALFLDLLKNIGEKIGNEMKTAAIYYTVAMAACAVLFASFSKYPFLDVILMALITVCVHGVNLMLVCNIPKHFSRWQKSSTMSGIFNSAVYVGSAASAYGTAFFATSSGWKSVCALWGGLIVVALVFCFVWRNKFRKSGMVTRE